MGHYDSCREAEQVISEEAAGKNMKEIIHSLSDQEAYIVLKAIQHLTKITPTMSADAQTHVQIAASIKRLRIIGEL